MIVLFDYDSLLYKAVYRIVSIAKIKGWFRQGKTRTWMENEIVQHSINRLCNMGDKMFAEIEETGIIIEEIEYYITYMKDPFRKKIAQSYKSNRIKNKWVTKVRQYLIESNYAYSHPEFEADDLIADRSLELNDGTYLILSPDKDLKTIKGIHFDYYKKPKKDFEIQYMRGLSVVTEKEAEFNFWKQMLEGDKGDNVSGLPGVGPITSVKMLSSAECYKTTVRAAYNIHYKSSAGDKFYTAYQLLKLGTKRNLIL